MNKNISQLEEKTEYTFKDKSLLKAALTHSSYANEHKYECPYNERLEFLGDAVVSLTTARFLFEKFPDMPEGDLSKRAPALCARRHFRIMQIKSLSAIIFISARARNVTAAERAPLIWRMRLKHSQPQSILTAGLSPHQNSSLRFLSVSINTHHINFKDYKTILQEVVQRKSSGNSELCYNE